MNVYGLFTEQLKGCPAKEKSFNVDIALSKAAEELGLPHYRDSDASGGFSFV